MGDALIRIGAKQPSEGGRRLDPGLAKLDRIQRDRLLDLRGPEPELLADPGGRGLELPAAECLVLEPPAPMLAPAGGGLYQ
jgi:hypothetical protein